MSFFTKKMKAFISPEFEGFFCFFTECRSGATQTHSHMVRPRKSFITNPSTLGDVRDLAFSDYAFAALLEDGHVTTWGLAVCSWTQFKAVSGEVYPP